MERLETGNSGIQKWGKQVSEEDREVMWRRGAIGGEFNPPNKLDEAHDDHQEHGGQCPEENRRFG